ncbi:MAG: hypothetical protein L0322_17255, partial [Chloroflexi bacterium]|nr:hypothetical protein [Chloroflexota bacterium]
MKRFTFHLFMMGLMALLVACPLPIANQTATPRPAPAATALASLQPTGTTTGEPPAVITPTASPSFPVA